MFFCPLWLSQRSWPDMQLATGHHCTRVQNPTVQNWKKLGHLMQCLWKTRFIPLIAAMGKNRQVCICVGGAHAVHMDAKGAFRTLHHTRKGCYDQCVKEVGCCDCKLHWNRGSFNWSKIAKVHLAQVFQIGARWRDQGRCLDARQEECHSVTEESSPMFNWKRKQAHACATLFCPG